MDKIKDWDFKNIQANSTTQLINRQKSALKLKVLELDKDSKIGTFYDPKNGKVKASLEECECRDFHYIGKARRKTFTPCMHIYRLAIELGLMEARYVDSKTKSAMMSPEEKILEDLEYLQLLEKDPSQWGSWSTRIHYARAQKNRQYRAYEIADDTQIIDFTTRTGIINDYHTTLESCTCPDFKERYLPCKHIYCLALMLGIPLSLSKEEYQIQKDEYNSLIQSHEGLCTRIQISKTKLIIWSIKAWLSKLWKKV